MPAFEWCADMLLQAIRNTRTLRIDCSDGFFDTLEATMMSLELIYREFTAAEILLGQLQLTDYEALNFIKHAYDVLRDVHEKSLASEVEEFHAVESVPLLETYRSGLVGRPKFVIPRTQLLYLIENRFTIARIAKMLGVSERTVYRRMNEFGFSVSEQYANLTDDDLYTLISEIQEEFPMCGNRQMTGYLLSRGFRVQQSRVRETQRRVSPEGTLMRRLQRLHRRHYSVAGPRTLYHLDGNHKLIK